MYTIIYKIIKLIKKYKIFIKLQFYKTLCFVKFMKHIVSLNFTFFVLYNVKYIFWKQTFIIFLHLFILKKVDEIFVNICKYSQISENYVDIRKTGYSFFSKAKQIEKLDIRKLQSKSQIPKYMVLSVLCPPLVSCVSN